MEELGHLDEYNGRFAVTPEYPDGIYAYYVTIHEDNSSAFPYIIGPEYYGEPEMDNIGPWSNVTIPGEAVEFTCDSMFVNYSAEVVPEKLKLYSNYPNPFNPTTTISYVLSNNAWVNISIYDMLGRRVKTLINRKQSTGFKTVEWNATNDAGDFVSSGVYLYVIQSGKLRHSGKMVLLK